jgi:hypothetical protein
VQEDNTRRSHREATTQINIYDIADPPLGDCGVTSQRSSKGHGLLDSAAGLIFLKFADSRFTQVEAESGSQHYWTSRDWQD